VGGTGDNVYDTDALPDVAVVIDLGGNDTYREGTVSAQRPVMIILDLGGNVRISVRNPVSKVVRLWRVAARRLAGDDKYEAQDVAQEHALPAWVFLIDHAGNDTYRGLRRKSRLGHGWNRVLIDRAGDDSYHSSLYAQDLAGRSVRCPRRSQRRDHYYAGGKWPDPYDDTPGYDGWSQGVGVGPRGIANGGIGMLLDGGGDDIYEGDYFSTGGGYCLRWESPRFWWERPALGATRLAYDGFRAQGEEVSPVGCRV